MSAKHYENPPSRNHQACGSESEIGLSIPCVGEADAMNTLRRTTIFLHDAQMKELSALAKRRGGLCASQYVRMAIDEFLRRERGKK
jgi:hypothetical protein